jgi:glutamate-1-semialdehyde 2,1-aminomutase
LGHHYEPLVEDVLNVVKSEGIGIGLMSEWEIRASQMICKYMKNVEKVRYLQSGTEADIAAVRIARAATGREKIIRMGGAYHGWSNEFLYDMQIPFSGAFECHGVPKEYYAHIVSVPPNDRDALLAAFEDNKNNVAGVILEPAGPETGAILMDPGYLKLAREACSANGSLLIFDEVVTCFRFAMGGASEYYGVDPDLTVLGKVLTHGFPSCGAIGGKTEFMDYVGSGAGTSSKPVLRGTMAANIISCCATYFTIQYLEKTGAIEKSIQYAEKMRDGLNDIFESKGLPFFCYNTASFVHYETACPIGVDLRKPDGLMEALQRKNIVDNFALVLQNEGLITKYGNRAIVSLAHSDEDLACTLRAFDKTVEYFQKQ